MAGETLLTLIVLLFPVSEVALAVVKRARRDVATVQDRGSMRLLWFTIIASVALAAVCAGLPVTRLRMTATPRAAVAIGLLVGGLALRWYAILTLGRLFTVDVAIRSDHTLVETGPYRYVRHPSYTGMLVAFLGVGVYFGNWLSIAALIVPIGLAVMRRIRVEEAALSRAFGAAYSDYCARTSRLIPGVV
jgi:protein-S-isoprenylcysteine O-methyltransferase Ste14